MGEKLIAADQTQERCQTGETLDAATREIIEQGQPLILEWRRSSYADGRLFESDASCGCGPID